VQGDGGEVSFAPNNPCIVAQLLILTPLLCFQGWRT